MSHLMSYIPSLIVDADPVISGVCWVDSNGYLRFSEGGVGSDFWYYPEMIYESGIGYIIQ
jgi:hypothetical protein